MKRVFDINDKESVALNERITDELLEQANEIVNKHMSGRKEDKERECRIWGKWFPNRFSIDCRTPFDFRDYKFDLKEDGTIEFCGMEGDFRD